MKRRILLLMMTTLLSVGAGAANDLTLNVGEATGDYGVTNTNGEMTILNWASSGWTVNLSQDEYYGIEVEYSTSTPRIYLQIWYEGDTKDPSQSIELSTSATTLKTYFSHTGTIQKIVFRYGDWEKTNSDIASITVTSAVVKAYDSDKDFTLNMTYAKNFNDWGTFNVSGNTIEVGQWQEGGWLVPLKKDKYCGVDFSFTATTAKISLKIVYADATEQSIEIPAGSTHIAADFIQNANISKIGFRHGDNDNSSNVSITITSAVVKAESKGEVTELSFSNLTTGENTTRDNENNSFTMPCYKWEAYWALSPAISSDDYEKVVITFSEAIPDKPNLAIHARNSGSNEWNGTQIGSLTGGTNKATAYFSNKPGVNIDQLGFYFGWNDGETATTLSIASAKLYKKPQTVTITDAKYATCVTTAATDFSKTDGIKAYIAAVNAAKTKVELTEVIKVAAGVPVILNGSAKDYTLHYTTASTDNVTGNELLVSDGTVTGDKSGTIYVLANGKSGVGFYPVEDGSAITAGKAYLRVPAGARQFIGFGDDNGATGIDSLTPALSKGEEVYYDLQGRRVAQPTKGLYIVNGKKVIIK